MTNFALENKRDGFFRVFESIGIWCNGNTTDSGPVILGSSPSIPTQYMRHSERNAFLFVCSQCVIRTVLHDFKILDCVLYNLKWSII